MKRFAPLGILGALLLVALFVVNHQRQQTPAYILSRYPQTEAFLAFTQNPKAVPSTALFRSVWFLDGRESVGMECSVDANGRVFTVRNVYNWAQQASDNWQLTPAQMAALKKALQNMPPNAAPPTLENLLVVHFRESGQPATRIYDRSQLPPAVLQLYQNIGALRGSGSRMVPQPIPPKTP